MLEYKSCVAVDREQEYGKAVRFTAELEVRLKETYAFNGRFTRRA